MGHLDPLNQVQRQDVLCVGLFSGQIECNQKTKVVCVKNSFPSAGGIIQEDWIGDQKVATLSVKLLTYSSLMSISAPGSYCHPYHGAIPLSAGVADAWAGLRADRAEF